MALAPFFAKTLQSASQVLAGFDEVTFTAALDARLVGIAWDASVVASVEARATLDLLTDLLARLYPRLAFISLGSDARTLRADLEHAARAINPNLEFVDTVDGAAIVVVVGSTAFGSSRSARADGAVAGDEPILVMYAGSDGWTARFSRRAPVGSGATDLVFGAGAAACIAAANIFRAVFGPQLTTSELDGDVEVSLLTMEVRDNGDGQRALAVTNVDAGLAGPLNIDELHLVGVGAIGHGAVWAWRRTPRLCGTIHLVDGENYEETNPQRYVETSWDASGAKAAMAASRPWASPDILVVPHDKHWQQYITNGGPSKDWRIARAALALDSAEARVAVQSSLPREVHNAWTRPENLGISRHNFLLGPCVACLYVLDSQRPNRDEVVARALGMSNETDVRRVRLYLDSGAPLEQDAIDWIADRLGLELDARTRAEEFLGEPLEVLYTRGLCGGLIVSLTDLVGRVHAIEVPLAFQSALAGLLLAADVVAGACGLRTCALPARSEVNLLAPLGSVLSSPHGRPASATCLCQDAEFVRVYREKYMIGIPAV
ncbi:MAG TPA: E2 ligase fold family C protein [Gemmatimonadales bacterium]|nr:E2 ligase fold family C protein [Gemmatimonadales bacterium]